MKPKAEGLGLEKSLLCSSVGEGNGSCGEVTFPTLQAFKIEYASSPLLERQRGR